MKTSDAVDFGAFLVYANGEFECECRTPAGTRRSISSIRRHGMTPTVRRHATDGRAHWNVDVDADTLAPVMVPDLRASFVIDTAERAPHMPSAVHRETAYGTTTRLTFALLCF